MAAFHDSIRCGAPLFFLRHDGAAYGGFSKQPLCEISSERVLITSVYQDKGFLKKLEAAGIDEHSFFNPEHTLIFSEIARLIKSYQPASYERLLPWAEGRGISRDVFNTAIQAESHQLFLDDAIKSVKNAQQKRREYETIQRLNQGHADGKVDLAEAERLVEIVKGGQTDQRRLPPVRTAWEIVNSPPDEGDTLIGDRFLCVGGGMVIAGPSGIGKSTFIAGFCVAIARGLEYLKILPARKLRTLVIQSENDDGDLHEQVSGAVGYVGNQDKENLSEYLKFVTLDDRAGDEFITALEAYLEQEQPEIVVIDCLHSYLGDSPTEARELSRFLRAGLTPLLRKFKCGCVIVHHTPKTTNQKNRTGWTASDSQYVMAGAADLPNWMRSGLVIEATQEPDLFRLQAVKRGNRLRWENSKGDPTFLKLIRHSKSQNGVKSPLRWEEADADDVERLSEAREKQPNKKNMPSDAQILELFPQQTVGTDPKNWLISTDEGKLKFREIGGCKEDFAGRMESLVKQGLVVRITGKNNAKAYALPEVAEKYRKATE